MKRTWWESIMLRLGRKRRERRERENELLNLLNQIACDTYKIANAIDEDSRYGNAVKTVPATRY